MQRHLLITLEESVTRGTQGLTVRTTEGAGNVLVQVPDNTTVVSLDELIQALKEIKNFCVTPQILIPAGVGILASPTGPVIEREIPIGHVPDLTFDENGNVVVKK